MDGQTISLDDYVKLDAAGRLVQARQAALEATPEWRALQDAIAHQKVLLEVLKVPGDVIDFQAEVQMITPYMPLPKEEADAPADNSGT